LPPVEEIIEIGGTADAESDSDDEDEGAEDRSRWLASGGKDARVALWCLMDFAAR
jgi:hypothetical protein